MQKKWMIVLILLAVMFIGLTGCTGNLPKSSDEATFKLGGLPCNYDSYYVSVYAVLKGQVLQIHKFGKVSNSTILEKTGAITKNADSVYIFLSTFPDSEPVFFWSMKRNALNVYENYYWLDYFEYANFERIKFGISEAFVQDITFNSNITMDFNDAPYYVYKLSAPDNRTGKVNFTATTGSVTLLLGASVKEAIQENSMLTVDSSNPVSYGVRSEPLYIIVRQPDYSQTACASLTAVLDKKFRVNGYIKDMVAGDTPDIIYGIDSTTNKLYYVNPIKVEITHQFDLPGSSPQYLAYSATDKKLFIADAEKNLIVWNTVTNAVDKIDSTFNTIYDMKVSQVNRRIYLLTASYLGFNLAIIDMGSGEVIATPEIDEGHIMALDENKRKLFVSDSHYSSCILSKYSIADDQLTFEKSVEVPGYNGERFLYMNPDQTKLILPGPRVTGDNGYVLDALSTEDMHVIGQWDIGCGVKTIGFSPNSKYLYGTNPDLFDNYLYIMDALNYSQLAKVEFPESNICELLTTNSDGSIVAAFSSNYYTYDSGILSFFTGVDSSQTAVQSKMKAIKWNSVDDIKEMPKLLIRQK